jgi:hypothetical protein
MGVFQRDVDPSEPTTALLEKDHADKNANEVPNMIPKRPQDKLENPYVPVAQLDRAAVS